MKPSQLPSGAWRCQVYLGKDPSGKRIYQSVTRIDKNECLMEAAKLAKHHHESTRDSSLLTLREAIDKYLQLKDGVLSPCTIRSYDSISRSHFQQLMNLPLRSLTRNIIQQAVNDESKRYAPKTVSNAYHLLTVVLNQFTDQDLNIKLMDPEEREVNTLNDEQLLTFIMAIQGDRSEIPILLALFLGLRRSEILALEHEDFDPDTNILSVTKAKVPDKTGQYVVKRTKTKKGKRKISVPPYLADRLNAAIERGERFFCVSPERPYRKVQWVCKKYNLPQMSFHDLRHQNASIMLALNIPDKYAMERGGWASTNIMKRTYQHTMDQQRRAIDAAMNAYFENLVKPNS